MQTCINTQTNVHYYIDSSTCVKAFYINHENVKNAKKYHVTSIKKPLCMLTPVTYCTG